VYNEDGSVGHRLLNQPTYGLLRYADEVLAQSVNSPLYSLPWRIHRFVLRGGSWQEAGHIDFPLNVAGLTDLRGHFFGIATSPINLSLVSLTLSGEIKHLWMLDGTLSLRNIAMSPGGDLAIGARGYVIRLHRENGGYAATWYAPRDCVRYADTEDGPAYARCVGMAGTPPYEHHYRAPPLRYATSGDGNWILPCCIGEALHFINGRWTATRDLPPVKNPYYESIDQSGNNLFVYEAHGLWVRHLGAWSKAGAERDCGPVPTVAQTVAWCFTSSLTNANVTGYRANGSSFHVAVGPADSLGAGVADDAWFSVGDKPVLGHIPATGAVQLLPVQSPIASLSRSSAAIWFREKDRLHYGYVDVHDDVVHEFDLFADAPIVDIRGALHGAWIEYSFLNRGLFVRHVAETPYGLENDFIRDIRSFVVAPDGSVWAQNNSAFTIERLSESGEATLYRIPCLDPGLTLLHAPDNGVWFVSNLAHCTGLIDGTGIHVRSLPLVDYVDYK